MASRFRVFNCYGVALVREINTLKKLQRDVPGPGRPFLKSMQAVETERQSAIAALVAQVEMPSDGDEEF